MQKTSFKFLVIGDACIDEYRIGSISRVNPEAPVPLLEIDQIDRREGMALNVAANLEAFGAVVEKRFPALVSKKIRYVDGRTGNHLLRVDKDVCPAPYEHLSSYPYDAVVISDYAKGFVEEGLVAELQSRFNGPIFVDTKRTELKSYENVYYKINEIEYSKLETIPKNLIVTLGAKGCSYEGRFFPGIPVRTVDVCGAGDTFLAGLAYGYLWYASMDKAIGLANKLAAVSCRHLGTHVPTAEEIACVF